MDDLYSFCCISKQGHYNNVLNERIWKEKEQLIVGLILQVRDIHPSMGLRNIYETHAPKEVGRDAFIEIGIKYGFRLVTFKNQARTTFSSPYSRYKNLLVDKVLTDKNQLWTSDITYFAIGEKFYYIVLIMDVYTRFIVGYSVADNMRAENNCDALKMAFKIRKNSNWEQLIHHSDRGGQYISDMYIKLLTDRKIKISMCNEVLENAHIERVNGTIKNEYLRLWKISNEEELKSQLKRTIDTYNYKRPHSKIGKLTPNQFEQEIEKIELSKRTKMNIWTYDSSKKINTNQCIIQF